MPKISYVNGSYVAHGSASVHIEDRGYQFADGVYEVIACIKGVLADERGHMDRLERSLGELQISMPVKRNVMGVIMRELLRRNNLKNAALYIQVTRGTAKRDFKFPKNVAPNLVMICWPFKFDTNPVVLKGGSAITVPDQRWARRDIKTIALLPQTLAKQKAAEAGAYEAWMVGGDGLITEGSSSNAWILKGNILKTHKADRDILKGITRTAVEKIAALEGLVIEERAFTPEESYKADEAFCTSATGLIVPIVSIDNHKIGDGRPGPVSQKIYKAYRDYVKGLHGEHLPWTA